MKQLPAVEAYPLIQGPEGPEAPLREEKEIDLRDYWKVLLKRRWTVFALFSIVVVTTMIATFAMKPIYRGTCTIQIDKENPQIVDFKEIFAVNTMDQDYYQTQYKILESRTLARRVIESLKLKNHPEFSIEQPGFFRSLGSDLWNFLSGLPGSLSSSKKDSEKEPLKTDLSNRRDPTKERLEMAPETARDTLLVNRFLGKLKIEPIRNSRLVKIHFDSNDRELSPRVANELAAAYIQQNLDYRFSATEQAKDWLTAQIDQLKAKVERADEALQAFGSKHDILSLEEKENITMQRLAELNEALAKAEADRMAKEALYRQTFNRKIDSLPMVFENKLILELKQTYVQLESQYMKLSQTYKSDYPEMVRLKKQMDSIQRQIDAETERVIAGIRNDYEAALRRESLVRAAFAEQKARAMEMKDKAIQYNILKREADTNRELYKDLLQRMKQASVTMSLTASNIKIVDRAEVPTTPHKPNKTLNFLLSVVVGLFLGVGLAFFLEYLDNTVKTPEEVETVLRLPSFGLVPEIASEKRRGETSLSYPVELITHGHPKSMLAEAYRNIRTSVLLSFSEHPPKTLLFSSANPGEGKTTTAINTAIALAQTGAPVLVIDADLRKPRLHRLFVTENGVGLSSYLSGNASLESVVSRSEVPNLCFIPAGPLPPNPSELLGSNLCKTMIESLKERFAHILLDSPPILGFADTVILSNLVDGVVLVAEAGKTPRETLQHARDILLQVNAKILGVVINRVALDRSDYGYYYYRYYYYYGSDGKKKKRKKELTFETSEEQSSPDAGE